LEIENLHYAISLKKALLQEQKSQSINHQEMITKLSETRKLLDKRWKGMALERLQAFCHMFPVSEFENVYFIRGLMLPSESDFRSND
jgi:hypothetical protein